MGILGRGTSGFTGEREHWVQGARELVGLVKSRTSVWLEQTMREGHGRGSRGLDRDGTANPEGTGTHSRIFGRMG